MKENRLLPILMAALACLSFWVNSEARAQPSAEPAAPRSAAGEQEHLPGIALAQTITEVTGVAISPLLGVSAVGAYRYWEAEPTARAGLPWYCQPWAWGTGLALLGLIFLKDTVGAAAPALLKKPFDFLELFEDKLSALVASAAFVPMLATAAAVMNEASPPAAGLEPLGGGFAAAGFAATVSWWKTALYVPLCLGVFFVVWLSSHAINVLIALSPFGAVDVVLKLARVGLLALVAGGAWLNPWLGLAICLPIILLAWLVSGWAWRLTVFGTLCGWDILLFRRARLDEAKGVDAFLARKLGNLPVRTRGRLRRTPEGGLVFHVRPWLLLPGRSHRPEPATDGLVRGLLFPCVTSRNANGAERNEFFLRPSLREESEAAARLLGLARVRDGALRGGWKSARAWFASMGRTGDDASALPG